MWTLCVVKIGVLGLSLRLSRNIGDLPNGPRAGLLKFFLEQRDMFAPPRFQMGTSCSPSSASLERSPRKDLLPTHVEPPYRIFLVYIRGLLQETELFRSVRSPNADPIPSRGPLERAVAHDQERKGPPWRSWGS